MQGQNIKGLLKKKTDKGFGIYRVFGRNTLKVTKEVKNAYPLSTDIQARWAWQLPVIPVLNRCGRVGSSGQAGYLDWAKLTNSEFPDSL